MSLFHGKAFSKEEFDCELDVSGLGCPKPVLRTMQKLNEMERGQVLHIITTDRSSMANFAALCESTGHALRGKRIVGDKYHYLIRKV